MVPLELKGAIVTPLVKDSKLDPSVYKDHRPIPTSISRHAGREICGKRVVWTSRSKLVRRTSARQISPGIWACCRLPVQHDQPHQASVSYYHLKNIFHIRSVLTQNVTETVVHAFNSTRLDYCNGHMYGLSRQTISQLQRVQNSAARLIT